LFAARKCVDLADLNRQALEWATERAAARPWVEDGTRLVRDVFAEEQSKLLPLPDDQFPAHERVEVEIGKTPYARFDLNDYSVPHDRVRRSLTVVADLETVRILDGTDVVAVHVRCWDRDQQIEESEHLARLAQEKRRARGQQDIPALARAARQECRQCHRTSARTARLGRRRRARGGLASWRAVVVSGGLAASSSRGGGCGAPTAEAGGRECYDNAVAESFFASLKTEWVDRHDYATHAKRG
jgi:hypothetical protein